MANLEGPPQCPSPTTTPFPVLTPPSAPLPHAQRSLRKTPTFPRGLTTWLGHGWSSKGPGTDGEQPGNSQSQATWSPSPTPWQAASSGQQVAAPARVGVGPLQWALAKFLLTFSRWHSCRAASTKHQAAAGAGGRGGGQRHCRWVLGVN